MSVFTKQLDFGKKYEIKFADLTKQKYIQSEGVSPWDIEIFYNNQTIKYEIKTDKRTFETGNFAIEYESNGKKSGISISDANYWVFNEIINYDTIKGDKIDYQFNSYLVPLKELKDILKTCPVKHLSVCENGKNKVMLLNKKYLNSYKVDFNKNEFFIKNIIKDDKEYTIEELELMLCSF